MAYDVPMSITFSLATTTPEGTGLACTVNHGACVVPAHASDEDIVAYSFPGWCVECSTTNADGCTICGLSLNVSNSNAQSILAALGVPFDFCGSIAPMLLLNAVRTCGGNVADEGTDTVTDWDPRRATLVECGLPAGYFAARFGALADLAEAAMQRGLVISWG